VCAAVPLLFLGAEVTTKKVGMVDPVGLREPWHLLTIMDRALHEIGLLIEHSHRAVGFIVGICIIVLAVALWLREPRRWVCWLGTAALAGVCIQGLLGIFRVNLHALVGRELALVHGCVAQLVFAMLVSLALCTSRHWTGSSAEAFTESNPRLQRWSIVTAVLIYMQLVLGALVRHTSSPLGPRGHLLAAFAVVAAVMWLVKLAVDQPASRGLIASVATLGVVVGLQLMLGVEAWMLKFSAGVSMADLRPIGAKEEVVRTAHFLVGSGVFATSVATMFEAHRHAVWNFRLASVRADRVEVAV
jgi:cytochrome c oxidase assembly protein subunit 15